MPTDALPAESIPGASLGIDEDALLALEERARSSTDLSGGRGEEQALESHEVVELQAFSERKDWITEKIKFLEAMPSIELFVGLDAVKSSAPVVDGLPSREELAHWLAEHDKIEKDTESFDSGELKKFKKFTKAAAKRNLSPQDTDLIELTLTTILEFDKLLHLLRDRSETLDLLDIRLTWEEHRNVAWTDRFRILEDLKGFLTSRARWSPAGYEPSTMPEEHSLPRRRGSIASVASVASDASNLSLPGLSRATRYKQAESLSREAAQFASRITSLRHGRIAAAGKALDKLIDRSRKPVPEELLDEQDKLEEQGIAEMEGIGKFVMEVVTQWRKADEFYVETIKDQSTSQQLLDDLDTVKLSHPSQRQDVAFSSRASAIARRLQLRGSPLSPTTVFPRPYHPLFLEQLEANTKIAQFLDAELSSALSVVRNLEESTREYHAACEAVKLVDSKTLAAAGLTEKYESILERLRHGVDAADGDGTPLNLDSMNCLNSTSHSAYLALLPTLMHDLEQLDLAAHSLLPGSRAAILSLSHFAIDTEYKEQASTTIDRLSGVTGEAAAISANIKAQVRTLREVRRIWLVAESVLHDLLSIKSELEDASQRIRWKPPPSLPATPESVSSPLPSPASLNQYAALLGGLRSRLVTDVQEALPALSSVIPSLLFDYLSLRSSMLLQAHGQVQQASNSAITIEAQSTSLTILRADVHDLRERIDGAQDGYSQLIDAVLASEFCPDEWNGVQTQLDTATADCTRLARDLIDDIPRRIPFIAGPANSSSPGPTRRRRTLAGGDLTLDALPSFLPFEPTIDLFHLDDTVRSECNMLSVHLSGDVATLEQCAARARLARRTRNLRQDLEPVQSALAAAEDTLARHEKSLGAIVLSADALDLYSAAMSEISSTFAVLSADLACKLDAAKRGLSDLMATSSNDDVSSTITDIIAPFSRDLDILHDRYAAWVARFKNVQEKASTLQQQADGLLQKRREEEIEQARLELEARRERERQEAEQLRLEEERKLQEKATAEKLERERAEADMRAIQEREEQERQELAECEQREREAQEERERQNREAREAEERHQREAREVQERLEQEIREEQERIEQEKRVRAEQERDKARQEAEARAQVERNRQEANVHQAPEDDDGVEEWRLREEAEDVFGPSQSSTSPRAEFASLSKEIHILRERLRELGFRTLARPSPSAGPSTLPSQGRVAIVSVQFSELASQVDALPPSVRYAPVNAELRSLRADIAASESLLQRVHDLSTFVGSVQDCDAGLSDLLEHIDSFPSMPIGPLSSSHVSSVMDTSEEQLSSRIRFTRSLVTAMQDECTKIADDHRVSAERARVTQTWQELEAMAIDRVNGQKSRPSSAVSSGRSSRASIDGSRPNLARKKASHYSTLSFGSPRSAGKFLSPGPPLLSTMSKRSTSSREHISRPPSIASMASSRSTSGPMFSPSGRILSSTFASRQRTTSLSSNASSGTPIKSPPIRPRAQSNQRQPRIASPTPSDASTSSRSFNTLARSTNSRSANTSTWSRAPRLSFPTTTPNSPTRSKLPIRTRKAYVANPKNKLDVAVGDIVNNLPVAIDIEAAEDSWRDQSGRYWIGTEEPKLCFCRILRSQTVMVRVGGGWQELSKFIQTHFADSFRLLPETTVHLGSREEMWISSATLMEAPEILASPPRPPKTPEPSGIPTFALSTPNGRSPHSIKSSPSSGSPLTPLQFMRRADIDSVGARPSTPSKSSTIRPGHMPVSTPRPAAPIWKY